MNRQGFIAEDWIGPDDDNLDKLRNLRDELKKLAQMPGKIYLDKLLRLRYDGLMAGIAATPLSGVDAAFAQEYIKGQAAECLIQQQVLEGLIASFSDRIDTLQEAESFEEEEESYD